MLKAALLLLSLVFVAGCGSASNESATTTTPVTDGSSTTSQSAPPDGKPDSLDDNTEAMTEAASSALLAANKQSTRFRIDSEVQNACGPRDEYLNAVRFTGRANLGPSTEAEARTVAAAMEPALRSAGLSTSTDNLLTAQSPNGDWSLLLVLRDGELFLLGSGDADDESVKPPYRRSETNRCG